MKKINYGKLNKFIASDVVKPFYDKRIEKLTKSKIRDIANRKNPYLFKVKNILEVENTLVINYML